MIPKKSIKNPSIEQIAVIEEQKKLFDNLRDGIFLLRGEKLLLCNSACARMLNLDREEITLKQIIEKLAATMNTTARSCILQLGKGLQFGPIQFESSVISDTPSTFEIQSLELFFMGEQALQVIIADLTSEYAVETELFETLSLFNSIFNAIDEAIFILNESDLTLQSSNAAMEQTFKLDRVAFKGKTLWDLIPDEEDAKRVIKDIKEKLPKNGTLHYVFEMKRKDGIRFPALHTITEIKDSKQDKLAIMWIVSDMSHNEYLNKALAEVETRYQVLFNRAGDATFIIDIESRQIIDANHAAEEHLGFSRMEIIGKTIFDLTPPARRKALEDDWQNLIKKESLTIRGYSLTKSKSEVPIQTSMVVTTFGSRQVAIAAIRDISQQIKIEQERLRLEKLEAVRQVTGGIAHEFNQPLQSLMTIAEIIELDKLSPEAQQSVVANIPTLVKRMDVLLNRMKGLVRLAVKPYVQADEILDFEMSTRDSSMLIIESDVDVAEMAIRVAKARGMNAEVARTIKEAKTKILSEHYDNVLCGRLCNLEKNKKTLAEIKENAGDTRIIQMSGQKKKSVLLTESELIKIIDEALDHKNSEN